RKLLDGSLDFISTIGAVSSVKDAKIDQANLGATGSVAVDVEITAAAERAELTASSSAFSAAANATASIGAVDTAAIAVGGQTINVTGPEALTSVTLVDD